MAVLGICSLVHAAPVTDHPRLLFRKEHLADLRSRTTTNNAVWIAFKHQVENYRDDCRRKFDAKGNIIDVDGTVYPPGTYGKMVLPDMDDGNPSSPSNPVEIYAMAFAFMSLVDTNATEQAEYAGLAKKCLFWVIDPASLGHDPNNPNLPFRQSNFATDSRSFVAESFPFAVDWLRAYDPNIFTANEKAKIRKTFLMWADDCRATFYYSPYNPSGWNNDPRLFWLSAPDGAKTRSYIRGALNNHYTNHERSVGLFAMCFDPQDDVPNSGVGDSASAGALTGFSVAPDGTWNYLNSGNLRDAVGVWLYLTDYALRNDGGGGVSQESFLYGANGLGPTALLMASLNIAGQDDTSRWGNQVSLDNHPFWNLLMRGTLAQIPPAPRALKQNFEYEGSMYENVPFGDMQTFGSDDSLIKVIAPLAIAQAYQQGPEAPLAKAARGYLTYLMPGGPNALASRVSATFSQASPRNGIYYFLLFDPKASPATDPRANEPASYFASFDPVGTMGHIFSRSTNADPAGYLDYRLGWNRIDHQHGDGNSFDLWYNGVWVSHRWAGYGVRTGCSDYQNTACFGGWPETDPQGGDQGTVPWAAGSEFSYEDLADPHYLARSLAPNYLFASGEAAPLYNNYTYIDKRLVTQAIRSLFWLKPGLVIIHDRMASLGSSEKKVWLNLQSPPVINGNTASLTTVDQWNTSTWDPNLGAVITTHSVPKVDSKITSLLPAGTLLSFDTSPPALPGNGNETAVGEEQTARLKIMAAGNPQAVNFLTVMELSASGSGVPLNVANLVQVAPGSTPFEGAVVGTTAVLFKADTNVFSTLTFSVPSSVQKQYVTGLAPNTAYGVAVQAVGGILSVNISGGNNMITDAGGVLAIANEPVTVSIAANQPSVAEGDVNPAQLTVSRSGDPTLPVTVGYSVTGTASPGVNYVPLSGQVTIPAGAPSATINVATLDDLVYSGSQTVVVTLNTNPALAVDDGASSATVTIVNSDPPPGGFINLTQGAISTVKNAGSVNVSAHRSSGSTGDVAAVITMATGSADGTDVELGSKTVSWKSGDMADKTVSFQVYNNQAHSGDKTAAVSLAGVLGKAQAGATVSAILTIVDSTPIPPGQLSFSSSTYSVKLSAGQLTIPVTRSGGTGGPVTLLLAVTNGSAVQGQDFSVSQAQLDWAAGESGTKSVVVALLTPANPLPSKSFVLGLATAGGTATIGSPGTATVTIVNDSPLPQQYDVGDGQPYPTIGSVPWSDLTAGSTVRIHYRAVPFHEKILISSRGTSNQPIKLIGIPGPNGERPTIDGDGATSSPSLGYEGYSYTPYMGVVSVARGAKTPPGVKIGYIEINGLEVRNTTDKSYVDAAGTSQSYWSSGGTIYLRGAEHVSIRNCEFHHASNGLVAECYSDEPNVNRDLLIETCYFHDNAKAGAWSGNNLQMEAVGVTVQFCRFDGNLNRGQTANIRDRSAAAIYRYNSVEGGSYLLELIEPSGAPAIVGTDPGYATAYVYGNVLVNRNQDGSSLVRFGAAYGSSTTYVRTLLHYYQNTCLIDTSSTSRGVFSLNGPVVTVEARNNIIHSTASQFQVLNSGGVVNLGRNWLKNGWFGGWNRTVNGSTNVLAGTDPGFVNLASADFHLTPVSVARNAAGTLAQGVPALSAQYKDLAQSDLRVDATDLGAFGFAKPPSITTAAASAIGSGAATLNGSINPNGLTASVWFEWGTTTNYGHTTSAQAVAVGIQPIPVSAQVTGLPGHSTIHFRAEGSNIVQSVFGADMLFTTPNTPPMAVGDSFNTDPNTLLTVPSSLLISNDTDPDLDSFSITGVANPAPAGSSVLYANGMVAYQAPANFIGTGSFTYTITDGFGGTSTATVTVLVKTAASAMPQLTGIQLGAGGVVTFEFSGSPSAAYAVETSTDLQTWSPLGSVQTGLDGAFGIDEQPVNSARFYRVKLQ